jgi:Holliday junction resolvasome RuvABC endonuclease subunit
MGIDPGMRHLGVAILEGENLVWYGVKTFEYGPVLPQRQTEMREYLTKLFVTHAPTVLAVEEPFYAQSLMSSGLKQLTQDIKTWGQWKELRVYSYVPPAVKAFFCRDRQTKQSLAEALIAQYPFLTRYFTNLPWRRRYWFHVFDAVGLALMCERKLARSGISPSAPSGTRAEMRENAR